MFQKDLIVWKPSYLQAGEVICPFVSEGLNSVETNEQDAFQNVSIGVSEGLNSVETM